MRIQHSFSRSDTGLNALLLSRLAQAAGQSQQDAASYCSPTACPPNGAAARQSPQKVMERVCAVDLNLYVNAYVLCGATQHILEPAGRSGMLPCHPAGLQQQHSNSSTTTTMKPSLYLQVVEQPLHKYASLYCCCPVRLLARSTELLVLVPASQTSVGIHCCNLNIHSVTVNGVAAQVWTSCSRASPQDHHPGTNTLPQ